MRLVAVGVNDDFNQDGAFPDDGAPCVLEFFNQGSSDLLGASIGVS